MTSSNAFLYQTCTFFLMAWSFTTRKRQRWVLPPFGAHTPAWMILRISASGTGSGLSRRMARIVRMISKRSVVSGMLVLPLGAYATRLDPVDHVKALALGKRLHGGDGNAQHVGGRLARVVADVRRDQDVGQRAHHVVPRRYRFGVVHV